MLCTLTSEQEQILFKKISRDLLSMHDKKIPFSLKDYVKSIYNTVKEATKNEALAQTYAGLVPSRIALARAVGGVKMKELINPKATGEVAELEELFQNFDAIPKYLGIIPTTPIPIASKNVPVEQGKAADAPPRSDISRRPSTFLSTTGNENDPFLKFSFDFIRHTLTAEGGNYVKSRNYKLAVVNSKDYITPGQTDNEMLLGNRSIVIITDFEGTPLYFDESFQPTSKDKGRLVVFGFRLNYDKVQTAAELTKQGYTLEEAEKALRNQKRQVDIIDGYIKSGKNRSVLLNIDFTKPGVIEQSTDFSIQPVSAFQPFNNNFNIVIDAASQVIYIQDNLTTSKIRIRLAMLKNMPEFMQKTLDILMKSDNVVDIENKGESPLLEDLRNKFLDVYFGNNKNLKSIKERLANNSITREELEKELTTFIGKTGKPLDSILNFYAANSNGVVSFRVLSNGKIQVYETNDNTEYLKFISDHAYTNATPNADNKIVSVQPYFVYSVTPDSGKMLNEFFYKKEETAVEENPVTDIYKKLDESENVVGVPSTAEDGTTTDLNELAFRLNGVNINTKEFTNPFGSKEGSVQMYIQWMLNGTVDEKALKQSKLTKEELEDKRNNLLNKINSGELKGKPLFIGLKKNQDPDKITHIQALDYFINKHNWGSKTTKPAAAPASVEKKTEGFKKRSVSRPDTGKLNSLIDQKLREGATQDQIDKAKEWWDNHPLGKINPKTGKALVPFEVAFNAVNSENPKSIAHWTRAGGILLFKGSDYSDLYHEAFHAFSQMFMLAKDRQKMYDDVRKKTGNFLTYEGKRVNFKDANDLEVEEYLAEEFRKYMLTNEIQGAQNIKSVKNWFDTLLEILKLFFTSPDAIINNYEASSSINQIFNNLRIGKVNTLAYGYDNMSFENNLNKIIGINEENQKDLDDVPYSLQVQLSDSVDAIFSEFVDENDSENSVKRYTTRLASNIENRAKAYTKVYYDFIDKYNEHVDKLETYATDSKEYADLYPVVKALELAIDNFVPRNIQSGDSITPQDVAESIKTGKGIIAYHTERTKSFAEDEKFLLYDAEEQSSDPSKDLKRNSGNEVSAKELADSDVIYVLKNLFDSKIVGDKQVTETNKLGFKKVLTLDVVWNKLQRILEGSKDTTEIYNRLTKESTADPVIRQLLKKLGPVSELPTEAEQSTGNISYINQYNLWTHIGNVFTLVRIPLVQTNIKFDEKGQFVSILTGISSRETNHIKRKWDQEFTGKSNRYVKEVSDVGGTIAENKKRGSVYLLIDNVLKDFKNIGSATATEQIRFLNAIGINLTDQSDIRYYLANDRIKDLPKRLYAKLEAISKFNKANPARNIFINRPADLVNAIENIGPDGASQSGLYEELLQLEARFSDQNATPMVSNAKGDSQWELSLKSTISTMITTIDRAQSYGELVGKNAAGEYINPHMAFLDVDKSPMLKSNSILITLFGQKFWEAGKGNKQSYTTLSGTTLKKRIKIQNSSGVALIEEDFHKLGLSTNEADETTHILQNFYSLLQYGVNESVRHSDKSTTYLYNVFFGDGQNLYIPIKDFAKVQGSKGRLKFRESLRDYLAAEIERVYKLKNGDPSGNALISKDLSYKQVGSKLVAFEDILPKELRNKIENNYISTYEDFLAKVEEDYELAEELRTAFDKYFDKQVEKFKKDLNDTGILNSNNSKLLTILTDKVGESSDPQQAIIEAYVANDWLHKYNTVNLFYGDVAIYNHAKEEFHKRDSGIGGTGTVPRTDASMLQVLDSMFKNRYAESIGHQSRRTNGHTYNSAVVEDPNITSIYAEKYIEIAIRKEKERLGVNTLSKEKEDLIRDSFKPYGKMEIADGQGFITFDAYRNLLFRMGKWSDYQEELYNKIIEGKDVSVTEIGKFFPIKKMQYYGPLDSKGLTLYAYHKFSVMPLIPTIIKDTPLQKFHDKLVKQDIDYALFQTGSKVNTLTTDGKIDQFYIDKTNPEKGLAFDDENYNFTKNTIFLEYFKDQVETQESYKGSVIFSSQLRKLLTEGMMRNGIPIDFKGSKKEWEAIEDKENVSPIYRRVQNYLRLVKKLTDYKINELIDEASIEYNPEDKSFKLTDKFIQFVQKELTRQDLAEHEIDFIKYDSGTNRLVYDLSIHPSAERIEKLITALIYKRIVKQKVNGEGLIQVSGAGFEPANLRKATESEINKYGTNGLEFYDQDTIDLKEKYKGYSKSKLTEAYETLKSKESLVNKWADSYRLAYAIETNYLKDKIRGVTPSVSVIQNPTNAMKAKIAIQGDFKKLLRLPEVLLAVKAAEQLKRPTTALDELNKLLKDENWVKTNQNLIRIAGVRIPVQGLNSMEFIQVAEFLPEHAGNMIILPAEIVAKTGGDFDIDKMSLMFPALLKTSKGVSLVKYNEKSKFSDKKIIQEKLLNAYAKLEEANKDVNNFSKNYLKDVDYDLILDFKDSVAQIKEEMLRVNNDIFIAQQEGDIYPKHLFDELYDLQEMLQDLYNAAADPIKEYKSTKIDPIIDEIDDLKTQISGISSEGIENDLLFSIIDILSLPESFVDLVTPNSTNIAKDQIADKLADDVRDYDPYETLNNDGNRYTQNNKTRISATRIFEIAYNRYKQNSNNIGKKTLGIGAVENTFNSIFNLVGAHMSLHFEAYGRYNPQVIRGMKHNLTENGEISLSEHYDAENNHKISNMISQLINGWVDVAKDSWIFDIQGNPEVGPVLLFMIQTGIPIKQAAYFLSQPIIREYVKQQKKIKSTFATALKVPGGGTSQFRQLARQKLLTELTTKFLPDFKIERVVKGKKRNAFDNFNLKKTVYTELVPTFFEGNDPDFTIETLEKNIKDYKKNKEFTEKDFEVFVHFIEIEEMAKSLNSVKQALKFDTNKLPSLFEIRQADKKYMEALSSKRIPNSIVRSIINNSPIGVFKTDTRLTDMISSLFKLRDNDLFIEYIQDNIASLYEDDIIKLYGKSFTSREQLVNTFINDFIPYIYQQYINRESSFNPSSNYKSLVTNAEVNVQRALNISRGAFVIGDTLYVDFQTIDTQYSQLQKAGYYLEQGFAEVSADYFQTKKDFQKFVYEREVLRSLTPYSDYEKTEDFAIRVNNLKKQNLKGISPEILAYEEYLRDTALLNIVNIPFLFKDVNGYHSMVTGVKDRLSDDYTILKSLFSSKKNGYYNLRARELKLTGDEANAYHEELLKLADPSVSKAQNELDNQIISKIFTMFPIFSFIQTGQTTKGAHSFAKIIDTTDLADIQNTATKWALEKLNSEKGIAFIDYYKQLFDNHYRNKEISTDPNGMDDLLDTPTPVGRPIIKPYYITESVDKQEFFIQNAYYDPDVKQYVIGNNLQKFEKNSIAVAQPTVYSKASSVNNPAEYTNHSGGAYGGDTFWDIIGREFGVVKHKHYREASNASLSQKLRNAGVTATVLTKEQMDAARNEVERLLGKKYPDTTEGNLQVRNYYQVANSDAVFAIAEITQVVDKDAPKNTTDITKSVNSYKHIVKGGTNTAVQLGIKLGKPVYVWDLATQSWYKWDGNRWFERTETPVLTKNFAGVGSRDIESYNVQKEGKWVPREQYKGKEIEEAAKQAIRDVYANTFKATTQPTVSAGVEISSNAKGLAAALTNPTELAKSKGNLTQSYPIEFNGKTYKDVEAAYQALKDKSEAQTKPTKENSKNYKLMVDLITAKLQQHPRLVSEITKQGGSAWILSSTHQPTKANTVWETGGQNWFIESLNDAYLSTQPTVQPVGEITISPEDITFKSNKLETFERAEGLESVKGYGLLIKNQPNAELFTYKDKDGWTIIDNKSKKGLPLRGTFNGNSPTKGEIPKLLSDTLTYYGGQENSRKILESVGFNFTSSQPQAVVKPVIAQTPSIEIQPGLELFKDALSKEEQREFYEFGKSILEEHGYNPFPQYVMASAGQMEWSPEEVVGKNGELVNRGSNYNKDIVSHKAKVKGSDGTGRWAYHYYLTNLDGSLITPIPGNIINILEKITGQDMSDYDTVLINLYPSGRTLGWHTDVTEDYRNLDRDIISVSIGADADFSYANTPDNFISGDPSSAGYAVKKVNLKSGDIINFGGPSRLISHTVTNVNGTTDLGPIDLSKSNVNDGFKGGVKLNDNWRMNFTFRVASPKNNKGKRVNSAKPTKASKSRHLLVYDKDILGFSSKNRSARKEDTSFSNTYLQDLAGDGKIAQENIFGITTKKKARPLPGIEEDFITDDTYEQNISIIEDEIQRLISERDVNKKILVFPKTGLGNAFIFDPGAKRQILGKPILSSEDLNLFNNAAKKGLPKEWFTAKSVFTEFYSNDTGQKRGMPNTAIWTLNETGPSEGLYDMIDKETGEVYISNVDLKTGQKYTVPVSTMKAPKTYVYLSKRLYEEFGYVNPGYKKIESTPDGSMFKQQIMEKYKVTDKDVDDALKECFRSLLKR
ncbi:hypothetical protein EBU95_06320 [bacterium]|nr:hypothetical protein [bacterium]